MKLIDAHSVAAHIRMFANEGSLSLAVELTQAAHSLVLSRFSLAAEHMGSIHLQDLLWTECKPLFTTAVLLRSPVASPLHDRTQNVPLLSESIAEIRHFPTNSPTNEIEIKARPRSQLSHPDTLKKSIK